MARTLNLNSNDKSGYPWLVQEFSGKAFSFIKSVECHWILYWLWICHKWLLLRLAPHSNTLAWKIPWTEEPGRLQSMGSLRVGHDWVTSLSLFIFMHWIRKWQPTPVFLPGESQGQGSLVSCRLWGRTESDTTEATSQQQQQQNHSWKLLFLFYFSFQKMGTNQGFSFGTANFWFLPWRSQQVYCD